MSKSQESDIIQLFNKHLFLLCMENRRNTKKRGGREEKSGKEKKKCFCYKVNPE